MRIWREQLFLGCSKVGQSDLVMEWWIELKPADLSFEALDSLLLSESVSVESEDALLRFILKLGRGYRGSAKAHSNCISE
jgi:hypothetical protein